MPIALFIILALSMLPDSQASAQTRATLAITHLSQSSWQIQDLQLNVANKAWRVTLARLALPGLPITLTDVQLRCPKQAAEPAMLTCANGFGHVRIN
ncbi:MAG: hypothetical protein RQ715_07935, partial [Methylococcales bacterium]|nr:hypothetical protein [Methylococcales bacterium]